MLAVLGAFGGLSYAANGVTHAVSSAVHVITPAQPVKFDPGAGLSSSQAQYRVAMCFFRHTISVDSHFVRLFELLGAKHGACKGGRFQPAAQQRHRVLQGQEHRRSRSPRPIPRPSGRS